MFSTVQNGKIAQSRSRYSASVLSNSFSLSLSMSSTATTFPSLTIGTTILEGGPDELDKVQLFEIDIDRPSEKDIPHALAWNGAEWTYD